MTKDSDKDQDQDQDKVKRVAEAKAEISKAKEMYSTDPWMLKNVLGSIASQYNDVAKYIQNSIESASASADKEITRQVAQGLYNSGDSAASRDEKAAQQEQEKTFLKDLATLEKILITLNSDIKEFTKKTEEENKLLAEVIKKLEAGEHVAEDMLKKAKSFVSPETLAQKAEELRKLHERHKQLELEHKAKEEEHKKLDARLKQEHDHPNTHPERKAAIAAMRVERSAAVARSASALKDATNKLTHANKGMETRKNHKQKLFTTKSVDKENKNVSTATSKIALDKKNDHDKSGAQKLTKPRSFGGVSAKAQAVVDTVQTKAPVSIGDSMNPPSTPNAKDKEVQKGQSVTQI